MYLDADTLLIDCIDEVILSYFMIMLTNRRIFMYSYLI